MNVRLEDNEEKHKKMKVLYLSIISICILAVVITIAIQIIKSIKTEEEVNLRERLDKYKSEFNNLFQNEVNYKIETNSYKVDWADTTKEIVYTGYSNKVNKVSDYNIDVNIPYINIQNSSLIDSFNKDIQDTFEAKAKDILNTQNQNVIYTVNYYVNVTNNILSMVIRSTLKEGESAERDIVRTYNYDLINKKEYTFEDMLNLKSISRLEASRQIKSEIKTIENEVNNLATMGYTLYSRDSSSDIYDIDNISEFFIGEDDALYVIFAYGNQTNTSELDIVVL